MELSRDLKVYVAGHNGLVGSAICREFVRAGFQKLVGWSSSELDLRHQDSVMTALGNERPDVVIIAAAKVGGIKANSLNPVEFINDNLRIQLNLMEAAHQIGVKHLLFLGSSCIYPRMARQPIHEDYLLTGELEPSNKAYAIAKIAGIQQIQSYRTEYGHKWISAMPTNLYGPRDNFDLENSHVLPALIRKFHNAKSNDQKSVTLWGTGSPSREFMHSDDLANACLFLLENYDSSEPINVGWGKDLSIRELARLVARVIGYDGDINWDRTKPDGTPRKLLDTSRMTALGWKPQIQLEEGIQETYNWFLNNYK